MITVKEITFSILLSIIRFVINNTLVTPPISDSILDGVTRDSLLTIASDLGYATEERRVSINELEEDFRNKTLTEAFGAGTAAVVAPIKTININEVDYDLPEYNHESLQYKLKQQLELIRSGLGADIHAWNFIV